MLPELWYRIPTHNILDSKPIPRINKPYQCAVLAVYPLLNIASSVLAFILLSLLSNYSNILAQPDTILFDSDEMLFDRCNIRGHMKYKKCLLFVQMLLHRFLNFIFFRRQKKIRLLLKHLLVRVTYLLVPELVQIGQADPSQVSAVNILIAQSHRLNTCQSILKAAEHQIFKHIIGYTIL